MTQTQVSGDYHTIYDFVFQMAAEGVLVVNAEGRCALLNPAAAAMLQVNALDVLGLSPREAFPTNPNLTRLLRRGKMAVVDIPLPKERIAQGIAQDLEDGRRVALLNDITEQRQLDTRRDALIKAISHDLRNPLNALTGYADLVVRSGTLNERQERFMERIHQTSAKLWELTSSLVGLAWIEAGMPLEYVPFDLIYIIRQVVREQSTVARAKKIKLVISTQNTTPTIMGDPDGLKQAISHLVANAIQYSPAESNVIIHCWQQHHEVMCSVADRGIGIPPEELDLIWDRMWRSPDERVQAVPGGGIGLTFARTLIERHGGQIWADSKPGQGATFTFFLPFMEVGD
ncbi:MAG: HAMP domain-containing histidine kinase [Chloroflexi bacterium]|nr:HAMP domain-containing histidine kinase [Chloroflexota bacterium]